MMGTIKILFRTNYYYCGRQLQLRSVVVQLICDTFKPGTASFPETSPFFPLRLIL